MIKYITPLLVFIVFLTSCSTTTLPQQAEESDTLNFLRRSSPLFEGADRSMMRAKVPEYASLKAKQLKSKRKSTQESLVLAHYMPWFQTPEISGYWGNHWTMNTCDPEQIDASGQRDICAHYYPLIGPYDSIDPDLLEYHILLMKLSGIDGIVIDWYGTLDVYDWGTIEKATRRISHEFNKAGMKIALMYEDRVIDAALSAGVVTDGIRAGQDDMRHLEDTYFSLKHYVDIDERPVLFNFGPQFFKQTSDWQAVFSVLANQPQYIGLSDVPEVSATTYPWIEWPFLTEYLHDYYAWAAWKNYQITVGSANPGYHDHYAEGGWGSSINYLDSENGERFARTLAINGEYTPDILQLVTWNDFGEGTMIEPTIEYGYRFLTDVQAFTEVPYAEADLELATHLYQLRKTFKGNKKVQRKLNRAARLTAKGKVNRARAVLDRVTEKF